MAKKMIATVKLQVKGGQANPSPPIGPALGQHGVNIAEFCKSFNAKTQDHNNAAFDTALNSAQGSGGGTITFNCGNAATILFTTNKIITTPVTILGEGEVTLSGGNAIRPFEVNVGGILTLDDLTITAGVMSNGNGGAMLNYYGEVYIQNSRFTGNQTGPAWSGGAIENFGKLVITGSEFTDNQAGNGGALFLRFEAGDATITNTTFRENLTTSTTDGWGGAILLWDGADVTIEDSLFENNQADLGGAIQTVFPNSSMELTGVTLSSNTAGAGGGIYNSGTATLTGVTLSSNEAAYGGGIFNDYWMALKNVTLIFYNTADQDGDGIFAASGFIFLERSMTEWTA